VRTVRSTDELRSEI